MIGETVTMMTSSNSIAELSSMTVHRGGQKDFRSFIEIFHLGVAIWHCGDM